MPPTACASTGSPSGLSDAKMFLPALSLTLTCKCIPEPRQLSERLRHERRFAAVLQSATPFAARL